MLIISTCSKWWVESHCSLGNLEQFTNLNLAAINRGLFPYKIPTFPSEVLVKFTQFCLPYNIIYSYVIFIRIPYITYIYIYIYIDLFIYLFIIYLSIYLCIHHIRWGRSEIGNVYANEYYSYRVIAIVAIVTEARPITIQCETPKIDKLVYNSNSYVFW